MHFACLAWASKWTWSAMHSGRIALQRPARLEHRAAHQAPAMASSESLPGGGTAASLRLSPRMDQLQTNLGLSNDTVISPLSLYVMWVTSCASMLDPSEPLMWID